MNQASGPSDPPTKEEGGAAFKEFNEKLNALPTPEEKVAFGLEFMRYSISQEGNPHFREFWDARRQILPCFKENLNPAIRSTLWKEYVELTVEARRLKDILEEQSAFAIEQIDLAIQSIENDLGMFESLLATISLEFPYCDTIAKKMDTYVEVQRELNLLNTLASRLNSLRKEVVKTDMRIRFKAKFFKRLSELGDKIFPRRKELIEKISSEFENDVEFFVKKYFKGNQTAGAPYYAIREEIKSLQGMAKIFTLSSGSFNRTRLKLSECWDIVRNLEKEHQKQNLEKKQASSEQKEAFEQKIEELKLKSQEMTLRDLDREIDLIAREIKSAALHRDDIHLLKEGLVNLRAPHVQALEQKAKQLEAAEREALQLKREKIANIKETYANLMKEASALPVDSLSERFEEIVKELDSLEASKIEKQQLERNLRPLKDLIRDKKEESLLNLTDDQKKALENLKIVLEKRKERRQEIKDTLEMHRKAVGSSGLDFERAIQLRELIDQEKERFEKANQAIQEIEDKITELES